MAQVNVDSVINAFVKLRDKRSELKAAFDAEDSVLLEKMDKLKVYLLEQMNSTNTTQLGSAHGTAYQQIKMQGNCSDWPSFWQFLAEQGRFDMVEKRVSIKAVQEYYEQTGELPPGVNINQKLDVIIRRG